MRGPADPTTVQELWVALHGYGQLASDFVAGMRALDDGTRLLVAPEALSRFYDTSSQVEKHAEARVGASWMTREDRFAEIEDQLVWLSQAHAHYRAAIGRDVPLVVLGFSQGAAAASRWVASGAVAPAHLICWGGSVAPELPLGPESALGRTRCTMVFGTRDRFVTADKVGAEQARMTSAGFTPEFERFDGGHRLDDAALLRVASR